MHPHFQQVCHSKIMKILHAKLQYIWHELKNFLSLHKILWQMQYTPVLQQKFYHVHADDSNTTPTQNGTRPLYSPYSQSFDFTTRRRKSKEMKLSHTNILPSLVYETLSAHKPGAPYLYCNNVNIT